MEDENDNHSSRREKRSERQPYITRVNRTGKCRDAGVCNRIYNDEFVPTEEKATKVLNDGDNVEFLYFMGGGC